MLATTTTARRTYRFTAQFNTYSGRARVQRTGQLRPQYYSMTFSEFEAWVEHTRSNGHTVEVSVKSVPCMLG